MTAKIEYLALAQLGNAMPAQSELNGALGTGTITLPLMGGDEYEGAVARLDTLPNIRRICVPPENNEKMKAGGCR